MRLDDLTTVNLDWLARALEGWACTHRWSLQGRTPSPAMMRTLLYDQVSMQGVIRQDDDTPVAIVQLVDPDVRNGCGQLALLVDPRWLTDVGEPVGAFVDQVFGEVGLRKLTVLAHADELDVPSVFGEAARPVGRLVRHERRDEDVYVDLLLFEIWREGA